MITRVPQVVFQTRERLVEADGQSSFEWRSVTSEDIFSNKRIVLFAVPGAFTPACSSTHLPQFEAQYDAFQACGVDEIICLSVNDAFVMAQWAASLGVPRVRMLPDGNGDFTRLMGMLVARHSTGMGLRSWRYAMVVNDGEIEQLFVEEGKRDDPVGVPVVVSSAEAVLAYLRQEAVDLK